MAGNKNSGGKKGRSGRKGWRHEIEVRELYQKSMEILSKFLNEAYDPKRTAKENEDLLKKSCGELGKEQRDKALEIFKKIAPSKYEGDFKMSGICVNFSDGTKVEM